MDPRQFDRLATALASSGSRRRLLRGAAGSVVAGVALRLGLTGADAASCTRAGKKCKKHKQCCSGFCLHDGTCGCAADADCNDHNGCTVEICGPTSHQCYHIPVTDNCVECSSDHQCAGGVCCHGRCCPSGATCGGQSAGAGVCCTTCGNGQQCCDQIQANEGSLTLELAACVGEGQFAGYLSFCCAGGGGGYQKDPDTGQVGAWCVQPQRVFP
jgi:hypothetical protein